MVKWEGYTRERLGFCMQGGWQVAGPLVSKQFCPDCLLRQCLLKYQSREWNQTVVGTRLSPIGQSNEMGTSRGPKSLATWKQRSIDDDPFATTWQADRAPSTDLTTILAKFEMI